MSNKNNPYHRTAHTYEHKLSRPIIARIRAAEHAYIQKVILQYVSPDSLVLDVGAGTGYYTMMLAKSARKVIAIDDSRPMTDLLKKRLTAENVQNVQVMTVDLEHFHYARRCEIVAAIGVLDYVKDWQHFIRTCFSHAQDTVILSMPSVGIPGLVFKLGARFEKSHVYTYEKETVLAYMQDALPQWSVSMDRVGLGSSKLSGSTWILVAVKRVPTA
jgi:cyclopropane fatty-acyl-phospholipid synthase-like methyltransferase